LDGGFASGAVDLHAYVELWHRKCSIASVMQLGRVHYLVGTLGEHGIYRRHGMTTFDEREKSFEKKFAMDEELKFKSEQRRNKLLGEWAAGKLGLSGSAVDDYVKALRRADLATKGDEDVFQKLRKDFDDKGVAVSDADLRRAMSERLAQAVSQIEAERKG
jgi:hypothetical protein